MKVVNALIAFLLLVTAQAQEPSDTNLILIIDASNSMWGQIDGVNKIVIAREAVSGLVDSLPDETQVGLIAYGHRNEGDCEDIEVLQDIGPLEKGPLKQTINGISPKGKTPISSSITQAIALAKQRQSSAIVLVSDGLETCNLDPCTTVRTAKAQGIPFVLHVVGFDIASGESAQLECAAQEGGGLYLPADDAQQLAQALQTAYEKPRTPDGRLVVTTTAEGRLQDTTIRVTDLASGEEVAAGRTYVSAETNPRHIPLDDGKYRAEVKAVQINGAPKFEFEFEISEGSRVERTFDYSAGEVSVKVTRNGELDDAVVTIRPKGERRRVAGGRTYKSESNNPLVERVVAGTYDVSIRSVALRNGEEPEFNDVVVNGNERTELSYDYASGVISVGTRRGDTLVDSVIGIIDANGKNIAGGRTYTSETSNPKSFIVSPGTYIVRIREIRGEEREVSAQVTTKQTTEIIIDLDQP